MFRFLVFCGQSYYPGGGMHDFEGSFDTIEAAELHALSWAIKEQRLQGKIDDEFWEYNWAHIYDMQKNEFVWERG